MGTLTLLWVCSAALVFLASAAGCCWIVVRAWRGQADSIDGMGFASFFGLGLMALVALAHGLAQVRAPWARAGIVGVNVLVQPFSAYLGGSTEITIQ
jgi:hypothetical protein